jgi:hypothetical protein
LGLSHGDVVFDTIVNEIVNEIGRSPDLTDPVQITPDKYQDAAVILVVDNFKKPLAATDPDLLSRMALYQNENLLIAGVDIGSFEIDQVIHNVQTAISNFVSDLANPIVKRFVINMSFALVPCNDVLQETLRDYRDGVNTDFADLSMNLSALIAATYGSGHTRAVELTYVSDFSDFTKCLSAYSDNRTCGQLELPGDTVIILVGAAGNSGYNFPFAPALWEQVVSVSASDTAGNKASYSNTGEVMMPGTTSHVDVVGTSFASPRLALYEAEYLLANPGQGIECQGNAGILASPPLGYIPEAGNWESGLNTDLPLDEARAEYCP